MAKRERELSLREKHRIELLALKDRQEKEMDEDWIKKWPQGRFELTIHVEQQYHGYGFNNRPTFTENPPTFTLFWHSLRNKWQNKRFSISSKPYGGYGGYPYHGFTATFSHRISGSSRSSKSVDGFAKICLECNVPGELFRTFMDIYHDYDKFVEEIKNMKLIGIHANQRKRDFKSLGIVIEEEEEDKPDLVQTIAYKPQFLQPIENITSVYLE